MAVVRAVDIATAVPGRAAVIHAAVTPARIRIRVAVVVIIIKDVGEDRASGEAEDAGSDHITRRRTALLGDGGRGGGDRRYRCDRRRDGGLVHHLRVVLRDIHHFGLRGLDHDDFLRLDDLRRDLHLWRGLQVAGIDRLTAKTLHGGEHCGLIGVHRRTELLRPVEVLAHHVDDGRELQQGTHAGAEAGLLGLGIERITGRFLLQQPIAAVHHFLGMRRRAQQHPEQRIRIQRDRREQFLERRGRHGLGRRNRRERARIGGRSGRQGGRRGRVGGYGGGCGGSILCDRRRRRGLAAGSQQRHAGETRDGRADQAAVRKMFVCHGLIPVRSKKSVDPLDAAEPDSPSLRRRRGRCTERFVLMDSMPFKRSTQARSRVPNRWTGSLRPYGCRSCRRDSPQRTGPRSSHAAAAASLRRARGPSR